MVKQVDQVKQVLQVPTDCQVSLEKGVKGDQMDPQETKVSEDPQVKVDPEGLQGNLGLQDLQDPKVNAAKVDHPD